MERTFFMIKPDVISDCMKTFNLLQEISNNFKVVDWYKLKLTSDQARELYESNEGKYYYDRLIEFSLSGRVIVGILEGEGVIEQWREIIGNTDPSKAKVGTLRNKYGKGIPNNAVHGSDSIESAEREIKIFFK